jgi:hypothetical protein
LITALEIMTFGLPQRRRRHREGEKEWRKEKRRPVARSLCLSFSVAAAALWQSF